MRHGKPPPVVKAEGGHLLRNLFDQYDQHENRLTHALTQVLARNPRLRRDFVRFGTGADPPERSLSVSCQTLPDVQQQNDQQQALSEEEAQRRGVPDLWLWTRADGWALLCECKLGSPPAPEQLQGHAETARRLGFRQANLLVIMADESRPAAVPIRVNGLPIAWTSWARVFAFLAHRYRDGNLVAEFLNYLRIVEGHLMAEGHDIPPLTTFTGIPFGRDHPYTQLEAKAVLRALMAELRQRLPGSSLMWIEPAIRRGLLVEAWDSVGFEGADPKQPFNEYPHLTVGIFSDSAIMQVVLPNDAPAEHWRRMRMANAATLRKVLAEVAKRARPMRSHVDRAIYEPRLCLLLYQRHFHARRYPSEDGLIRFDLDVLFEEDRKSQVKHVPAWLDALNDVMAHTARANFEMALRADYPLIDGSVTRKPEFVGALLRTAEAFKPFVTFLLEDEEGMK